MFAWKKKIVKKDSIICSFTNLFIILQTQKNKGQGLSLAPLVVK